MTDLPTLEAALKLADQDCPLPSLAGPALKRLRIEFEAQREDRLSLHERAQVEIRRLRDHCLHAGVNPSGQDYHIALSGRIDHLLAIEKAATPLRFIPDKAPGATLTALIAELRQREELMGALLYSLAEKRTKPLFSGKSILPQLWSMAGPGDVVAEEITQPVDVVGCGDCAPPVQASPVYGIDHGTDDKTVEAFGHMDGTGKMHFEQFLESEPNSPNSGHGHVRPRPDGVKARCGGPRMCNVCWNEERNIETTRMVAALAKMPPVKIGDWVKVACDDAGDPSVIVIPETELYTCNWCEVCNPALVGVCMVLCPICGNKRCPHAHDHRNACTGSNAVGQPGSSWGHVKPATPPADKDC